MRVLLIAALLLVIGRPGVAQPLAPAAYTTAPEPLDAYRFARADTMSGKRLSLGRHMLTGGGIATILAVAGFIIYGQVEGYGDCNTCGFTIPIAVAEAAVIGAIGGALVYGARQLDARQRERSAPR